jgi:hypothetical protein
MNGAVSLLKLLDKLDGLNSSRNKLLKLEHATNVDDRAIIRPTVMPERIKMGMNWMTKTEFFSEDIFEFKPWNNALQQFAFSASFVTGWHMNIASADLPVIFGHGIGIHRARHMVQSISSISMR